MQTQPPTPLAELDGVPVERYASLDGVARLAKVTSFFNGEPTPLPAGIVIAVYQGESDAYIIHCTSDWSVLAAGYLPTVEAAISAVERGFLGVAERWVIMSQVS